MKKEAETKPPSLDESQKLYYGRVIPVSIDPEGFMSCTCGKMQQYLMPCAHICAVLEKRVLCSKYVPDKMAQNL